MFRGFSLSGLTDQLVRRGLAIWIMHLLAHFAWMAWEGLAEWRLRLTGTRVIAVTVGTFASEEADYPTDPRHSTLANWSPDRGRCRTLVLGAWCTLIQCRTRATLPQLSDSRKWRVQCGRLPGLVGRVRVYGSCFTKDSSSAPLIFLLLAVIMAR